MLVELYFEKRCPNSCIIFLLYSLMMIDTKLIIIRYCILFYYNHDNNNSLVLDGSL